METETTIVGHSANGIIRLAVLLPNSGHSIAEETRARLMEALRANYGGYELGNITNRDYGEGYTVYTIEITPKMPLGTRRTARGYFPPCQYRRTPPTAFKARFREYADITLYNDFPACRVARGYSEKNKQQ